jgi:hypothetical protein
MRNPKVARLSDKQFRLWVELLAVASENDGLLPCLDDLRYMLNRRLDHLSTGVEQLISMGLIDRLTDGYEPHNWSKFQYKSDTSNQRVARHRAKRNVTVTPPDTDTETETEVNTNVLTAKRRGVIACKPAEISDSLWGDWQRHRKAPFTETALKGFEREAAKAGWSVEWAITEAIERGWQGFKADWVKDKNNGNDGRNKNTSGAMGVTERAARQALHQISGGVGRFDEGRESDAALFIGQGHPAIDAQPNAVRSVGYAGG